MNSHGKQKWEIDVLPGEDFRCRIIAKGVFSPREKDMPRVDELIVGLPKGRQGPGNIFDREIARLIASAPDMYEALKQCLDLMENTLEYAGEPIKENNYKFITTALAKAEGEE